MDSPETLWKLAKWVKNRNSTRPAFTPNLNYQGRLVQEWRQKATTNAMPRDHRRGDSRGHTPNSGQQSTRARPNTKQSAKGSRRPHRKPLQIFFDACVLLQHYHQHFEHSATVVIPKPGKPSCKETKAYRPMALMNTIGKILDSVMARRLQYYTEQYHLLPRKPYGRSEGYIKRTRPPPTYRKDPLSLEQGKGSITPAARRNRGV